jgi:HlyD family secretion protein
MQASVRRSIAALPWRWLLVLGAAAAAAAAATYVARTLRPAALVTSVPLSGRIEGYQADLGAKVGGRVVWVAVREGAFVHAGQVVVRLDDAQARAQVDAADAAVLAAEQRVRQSAATLGVLAAQIDEARLGGEQARADTSGRVAQARGALAAGQAQVVAAIAAVREAQANVTFTAGDDVRYAALGRTGDVAAQRALQARTAYAAAAATLAQRRAAVAAARRNAAAAAGALALARSTAYNAPISAAQVVALEQQVRQARIAVNAARADVAQASAQRRQAQATLDDLTVRAASDGTVIARAVEPGDVVAPGRILLSVVDLDQVYLRGYVSEGQIGLVRVGQRAHVALDSDPSHPLDARVAQIDAEASFTPENVYFRDDRVQQVFGVRLDLVAPRGAAKPGMPADATIELGSP